jgi:hypothetical protein
LLNQKPKQAPGAQPVLLNQDPKQIPTPSSSSSSSSSTSKEELVSLTRVAERVARARAAQDDQLTEEGIIETVIEISRAAGWLVPALPTAKTWVGYIQTLGWSEDVERVILYPALRGGSFRRSLRPRRGWDTSRRSDGPKTSNGSSSPPLRSATHGRP